ncbi:LOW QUALITY PROTEIN: visinin-like [Eudromia elegans]
MGNSRSGALSRELLQELTLHTRYSEAELCRWYEAFVRQCPDGRISRAEFERIYSRFFPDAEPHGYARHVFRSFDTNDDGTLDFREYVIALHLTSSGKTRLKLEWAFALFDVDRNGEVSKAEVLEIVSAIFKMIPPEEQKLLPEDENSPQKRADKLWRYFNKGDNGTGLGSGSERDRDGDRERDRDRPPGTHPLGPTPWERADKLWRYFNKGDNGTGSGSGSERDRDGDRDRPPGTHPLGPTPREGADKLWCYFNKGDNDKIAEGEFIEGVMQNDAILRLIQYEPKK